MGRYRLDPREVCRRHITYTDTCWLWSSKSYGKFRIDGRLVSAHRFIYELFHGPIPHGTIVRHSCDVRACVSPDHLLLGTHALNADDRKVRGRNNTARGERAGPAKLTSSQVMEIRRRYRSGGVYQHDLAREYGVAKHTIQAICSGATWAHLPNA
jgi:hypothetical protein